MVSDHEGKERPDPPQQGAAQFFFYLPNLFPPTPRLCPGLSLLCSPTELSHRRSSSRGFINACCHPVAKNTETGLLRTVICLFGHDGTHIQPTHHPSPLYPSFPTPCVALSALPCHTHFISGLVVHAVCLLNAALVCCSNHIVEACSRLPRSLLEGKMILH